MLSLSKFMLLLWVLLMTPVLFSRFRNLPNCLQNLAKLQKEPSKLTYFVLDFRQKLKEQPQFFQSSYFGLPCVLPWPFTTSLLGPNRHQGHNIVVRKVNCRFSSFSFFFFFFGGGGVGRYYVVRQNWGHSLTGLNNFKNKTKFKPQSIHILLPYAKKAE